MTNSWIVNIYLDYLDNNFPKYKQGLTKDDLKKIDELYFSINDVYVTSSIFEQAEYTDRNYKNLLLEFKTYLSRVLLLLPLNDKYSIDALLRLLIEKLYRIIYGLNHLHLSEETIRRHKRSKMSERLGMITEREKLNELYRVYSELIHHSVSTPTDSLNLKQLERANIDLLGYVIDFIADIRKIYINDFFIPTIKNESLDLSTQLYLRDNTQLILKELLETEGVINS